MEEGNRQVIYISDFDINSLRELLETKKSSIIYVYNLKDYSEDIIRALISMGYADKTDKAGRTSKGQFTYLIGKYKKTFKIYVKLNSKVAVTFLDFCNIVAGNKIQLLEAYKKDTIKECMQEAIEQLNAFGMTDSSTIGGASLKIFKGNIPYNYNFMFPHKIYNIECPKSFPYIKNIGDLVRLSYAGGWCYVNPKYQDKIIDKGVTYDDNSLYPFCMVNFKYPVGNPTLIWEGEEPKLSKDLGDLRYRFYVILTRFKLKPGKVPFIKIKNDFRYKPTDTPVVVDHAVNLVLNETDYALFKECYDITYIKHIGGCNFRTESGSWLFGDYINKLYDIKQTADGVVKHTAKMLLNNLGGKFGSGMDSSHYVYDAETDKLRMEFEWNRQGSYIPVASAMTAYARMITITGALQNIDRFIYSDTDSLHLVGEEEAQGINISKDMGDWKVEHTWTKGYYAQQKQYSFITATDNPYFIGEETRNSKVHFVVAGMTDPEKWAIIEQTDVPSKLLKEQKNIC